MMGENPKVCYGLSRFNAFIQVDMKSAHSIINPYSKTRLVIRPLVPVLASLGKFTEEVV